MDETTATGDPAWALIDALAAHQKERGWTDKRMAEFIGVPRTSWTVYKSRKERPGLRFFQKALRARGFATLARAALEARESLPT